MFKKIKGTDDYLISDTGKVYSLKTKKYLQQFDNGDGYRMLYLCINGTRVRKYVHRLVLEAFIPKTQEDIELKRNHTDHIDGNRANNHVYNLRWVNNRENHNFKLARENHSAAMSKPIQIDGMYYSSITEASKLLNMKYSTVWYRLTHKNFPNYSYK